MSNSKTKQQMSSCLSSIQTYPCQQSCLKNVDIHANICKPLRQHLPCPARSSSRLAWKHDIEKNARFLITHELDFTGLLSKRNRSKTSSFQTFQTSFVSQRHKCFHMLRIWSHVSAHALYLSQTWSKSSRSRPCATRNNNDIGLSWLNSLLKRISNALKHLV